MRFWVSSPKSNATLRNLDSKAIEMSNVAMGLAVVAVIIYLLAGFLFVGAHAILLPMFLGMIGTCAAIPETYYQARVHTDKLRIVETKSFEGNKPLRVEWYQTLFDIDNLECNLAAFLATLTTDEYAYSHALSAYNTVRQELWEGTSQWRKIKPFIDSPKDSTRKLLEEEHVIVKQRLESTRMIVDQVFNLSLRSASFTRAPKTHLDILVRELDDLINSMAELDEFCGRELPSATHDLSIRKDYGSELKTKVTIG